MKKSIHNIILLVLLSCIIVFFSLSYILTPNITFSEDENRVLQTSPKFTFEKLLEKGYIPVTTAEFMGTKAYERAKVTADAAPSTFEELLKTTVQCNYPLAVINAKLIYPDGTSCLIEKKLFSGAGDEGVPRAILLSDLAVLAKGEFLENLKDACDYTLIIEVVASNGERFTPVQIII